MEDVDCVISVANRLNVVRNTEVGIIRNENRKLSSALVDCLYTAVPDILNVVENEEAEITNLQFTTKIYSFTIGRKRKEEEGNK